MSISRPLLLSFLGLIAFGCTSRGARVTLSSVDGRQHLTQDFAQAYISHDSRGEYDVILIDQGAPPRPKKLDQPLEPVHVPPLRQVMHLHLYWRPVWGTPQSNPAAINASVEWYVLGSNSRGEEDMVFYSGAGLVTVDEQGKEARLTIRDGQLRPTSRRGTLSDPIGPSVLSGEVTARFDDLRVRDLLAEIKQAK